MNSMREQIATKNDNYNMWTDQIIVWHKFYGIPFLERDCSDFNRMLECVRGTALLEFPRYFIK